MDMRTAKSQGIYMNLFFVGCGIMEKSLILPQFTGDKLNGNVTKPRKPIFRAVCSHSHNLPALTTACGCGFLFGLLLGLAIAAQMKQAIV